ncbi:hypothetical protein [Shinella sp.]|uniref:hypothetical protein n=1 Tax=Shinella sp. TaxID=1870904 RepID=UPI003F70BA40
MTKLTLSAAAKGAFRVTITGEQPEVVKSFVLTGSGDERELELSPGAYVGHVSNIGTGVVHDFKITLDDGQPMVLKVPLQTAPPALLRTVAPAEGVFFSAKRMPAKAASTTPAPFHVKAKNAHGRWVTFRGTHRADSTFPERYKISRPSTWDKAPVVKLQFHSHAGPAYMHLPMFSGGTLVQFAQDRFELLPCDEKAAAIVGSLSRSKKNETERIVQWASGANVDTALHSLEKKRDPWLVAAAGLVLALSNRPKARLQTASMLAKRNRWCGDLGVLAAWWSAISNPSDVEGCLNQIVEARKSGVLYFWSSLSLVDKMLVTLKSGPYPSRPRKVASRELVHWRNLQSNAFRFGTSIAWTEKPADIALSDSA